MLGVMRALFGAGQDGCVPASLPCRRQARLKPRYITGRNAVALRLATLTLFSGIDQPDLFSDGIECFHNDVVLVLSCK